MILAETHPDDHAKEIEFDATKWFEQASDDEIIALSATDPTYTPPKWSESQILSREQDPIEVWGQDYESDVISQFMADHNQALKDMFTYIEWSTKPTKGFECYVLANDARKWIAENRSHLVTKLGEPPEEFVIAPPGTPKERITGAASAVQDAIPDNGGSVTLSYEEVRAIRGYAENILIYASKIVDDPGELV